jgi:diguanylate cyclase (GGDEF)-like protein
MTATPFTVLLVDDDAAIRRLVRMMLKRAGYVVHEAKSGAEARALVGKVAWDLAILDRRLPDVDGAVLGHELRQNEEFRTRYIIVLTGEAEPQDKVEGLDLGADDYVTKPFQPPELLARIRAGKRIVDLQKELLASNKRLELLSITDGLTHLYNHRHFQDELTKVFETTNRYGRPLSLALIDRDFFKKVNDTYGHAAGDEVLKSVASLFMNSIRSADVAARYGGEEFAVLMPETAGEDAATFAEKVRALVEESPVTFDDKVIKVTVSIGVASAPAARIESPRDLVEKADKALYRAKRNGRNQVQFADGHKGPAAAPAESEDHAARRT